MGHLPPVATAAGLETIVYIMCWACHCSWLVRARCSRQFTLSSGNCIDTALLCLPRSTELGMDRNGTLQADTKLLIPLAATCHRRSCCHDTAFVQACCCHM